MRRKMLLTAIAVFVAYHIVQFLRAPTADNRANPLMRRLRLAVSGEVANWRKTRHQAAAQDYGWGAYE